MLKTLHPRLSYRTGRNDWVGDFFVPCLVASVLSRRCAGHFTSAGVADAACGADGPPIVNVTHYRLRQDSHSHPITVREEPAEFRARRRDGAS